MIKEPQCHDKAWTQWKKLNLTLRRITHFPTVSFHVFEYLGSTHFGKKECYLVKDGYMIKDDSIGKSSLILF